MERSRKLNNKIKMDVLRNQKELRILEGLGVDFSRNEIKEKKLGDVEVELADEPFDKPVKPIFEPSDEDVAPEDVMTEKEYNEQEADSHLHN